MNRKKNVIHVFKGSEENSQYAAFQEAIKMFSDERRAQNVELIIIYLSTKQLRNSYWTPFQFRDWLQDCDYHFILGHAHQGIPEWNGDDLARAYADLRDSKHLGFPSGEWLNCPILLQDKKKYLNGTS